MSDAGLVRVARVIVGSGSALALAGLVIAVDSGNARFWWSSFAALGAVIAWAFCAFTWLAIGRQPRNVAVWAMVASVGLGLESGGLGLAGALYDGDPDALLQSDWVPAQAPAHVAWILAVARGASVFGLFVPLILGLLTFPSGRLDSRRSRILAVIGGVSTVVLAVSYGWWHRPTNTAPQGPIISAALFVCVGAAVAAVLDVIARFRRSVGPSRQQYKWILWGTTIAVLVFGGVGVLPDATYTHELTIAVAMLAGCCWVAAYGIAVGRYRLYEIDVVISRTLVYGGLATLISGCYIALVVGFGALLAGSDLWLSVLAVSLIAVSFEPARTHLYRLANRLVYGRKATHYEVLADLTARLALSEGSDTLLARLVDQLRAGTGAARTVAWLDEGDRLRAVATAPGDDSFGSVVEGYDALPGSITEIVHQGHVLGYLTIERPPGANTEVADLRLAQDLAGSAALVVHNLRLERELQHTVADIEDSRQRMLRAQQAELRRIELELSTAVETRVVALEERLALTQRTATDEGAGRTALLLGDLCSDAHEAAEQIRSLAQGVHSPAHDADGLASAVTALIARAPLEIGLDLDLSAHHDPALEEAVYYCVAEALTNAAKHAEGPVAVEVSDRGGRLSFTVRDAGPGFDSGSATVGSGLRNIADRLDALGGSFVIDSRPGTSTRVTGTIPLRPEMRSF